MYHDEGTKITTEILSEIEQNPEALLHHFSDIDFSGVDINSIHKQFFQDDKDSRSRKR